MRRFRRSKGDKEPASSSSSSKFGNISVPHKDALAIQAPKKVIKALYDYQVQNPAEENYYLSFSQGDFLHVVGRENDPDWYEACNPIHGVRGLVPVNYFEIIGKQHQQAFQGGGDGPFAAKDQSATGHDSGFAEPDQSSFSDSTSNPTSTSMPRRSMGMGRGTGAMVYGIVQYDFTAERPDELDAKAGEAIIVIAQSNAEWFVAKPITRLGGPGLIPVSFIEIRDMTTGQAVPDTAEAVARAGVPKVEEWKRMAAEYKNSSIPLGQVSSPYGQQGLNTNGQMRHSNDPRAGHMRNGSQMGGTSQQYQQQQSQIRTSQLLAPVRARVLGFHHRHGDFWFNVDVTMEDGRSWKLERNYKDFYGLQLNLIEQFPEAAGKVEGCTRTLPYIPGPLPWVTEHVTSERSVKLDQYVTDLLKMSSIVTNNHAVRTFFYPRDYDTERFPDDEHEHQEAARLSAGSNISSHHQQYDSRQSSSANLNGGGGGDTGGGGGGGGVGGRGSGSSSPPPQAHHHQQQSSQSQPRPVVGHRRNASDLKAPAPMLRNNSNLTTASGNSNVAVAAASNTAAKIKVWFGDSTCVVIRLPATFNYADLVTKLRDRYSLEPGVDRERAQHAEFAIEYKDEPSGGYFKLNGDDELEIARQRNDKLTLKVHAISQM